LLFNSFAFIFVFLPIVLVYTAWVYRVLWGKVTEGMENVDKIKRGEPVDDPDKIVSMKVAADA